MDLQYYLNYIISWFYHNVVYTGATLAIVRILIIIGLVSLLVYQQYILFALLCIVMISAEFLILDDTESTQIKDMFSFETRPSNHRREVDKDELTTGVSLTREGFSLGMPKIIKGDSTGADHRRSNKFVEEDSYDFTDKYFSSKQCSIGSGAGAITMFGDNELIGSRIALISSIYDFAGNRTANDTTGDGVKRFKYFNDCVYEPVKRNDFREFKTDTYTKINTRIIDIPKCLARFNVDILFNTTSDINADISKQVTLSDKKISGAVADVSYVSIIIGETNPTKLKNIQPLNTATIGDNASESTYSALMNETNGATSGIYADRATKLRAIDIYGKVFGFRKRIDEILAIMREQTKNDAALLHTVRINESVVKELRMMLAYLAILQRSNAIITFEMTTGIRLYDKISTAVTAAISGTGTLVPITGVTDSNKAPISDVNNIFRIPLEDDSYNTKDEKRYLYGITYYFDKDKSEKPYS